MRKTHYKIVGIVLLCIAIIILFQTSSFVQKEDQINTEERTEIQTSTTTQYIQVESQTLEQNPITEARLAQLTVNGEVFDVEISDNTTVYDAMKKLKSTNKLSFEGKDYLGLGFFVTSVGSLKSGDGKNLMYYINGEEAQLGISSYVLKEGDIIEWQLK